MNSCPGTINKNPLSCPGIAAMDLGTARLSLTTHPLAAVAVFVALIAALVAVNDTVRRWYERNPRNRAAGLLEYLRSVGTGESVPESPGGRRI